MSLSFLFWLVLLQVCAVYLFTTGFFLTRFELPTQSECLHPPSGIDLGAHASTLSQADQAELSRCMARWGASTVGSQDSSSQVDCWQPRRFSKVIVLLVDALRFDFVAPYQGSPTDSQLEAGELPHFANQMSRVQQLLMDRPDRAQLFQFVADPPTVTMQRLKGLTTGGLPTFLDIKDNWQTQRIHEDNIIDQLKSCGISAETFTWTALC